MATNTSNKISAELCRAVDWKLFEITSCLISDEVTEEDFALSKVWFQERHAQDVVEERFACGLCAYPLCTQPLKTYVKASQIRDRAVPASPGTASTSSAKPSGKVLYYFDKYCIIMTSITIILTIVFYSVPRTCPRHLGQNQIPHRLQHQTNLQYRTIQILLF